MKRTLKKGIVLLLTTAMTLSTTFAGNITAFANPPSPKAALHVSVSKSTVVTTFDKIYDWKLSKTVDHNTWNLHGGATGTSVYTITAAKSLAQYKFVVEGDITVENKGWGTATNVTVDAALRSTNGQTRYEAAGTTITGGPASGNISPGATATYHYTLYYDSTVDPTTLGNLKVDAIIAAQNTNFITPNPSTPNLSLSLNPTGAVNDSLKVTDNYATATLTDDLSHVFTTSGTWTYSRVFSAGQAGTYTNTASATVIRNKVPVVISDSATVTVAAVNIAPDALNDAAITNEDVAVDINVLSNDNDADSDVLTVTNVTTPGHGTALINANGTVKYTPNANWNGSDTFDYTISDGNGGTDTATVTVRVNPVQDAPDAVNDVATVNEDSTVKISVLSNDTDADGDTLSITHTTHPSHGTIIVNPDKTITYKPDMNWNGTDTFTYTISDGHGGYDTAKVTVTVKPANDKPIAIDDLAFTHEDIAVKINVLSNDFDIDHDMLSVTSTTAPAHGVVVINPDNTVTYKPNANWSGFDSFNYTISDGNGGTDSAKVFVNVCAVNDAPDAADDAATTDEDASVKISVLSNDTDVEGNTLSITGNTAPLKGTVVVNPDKTITYTPNANWNGTDTFTYTISDGKGGTDTATVTVTVKPVNDVPDAVNDSAATDEDVAIDINVLTNDTDIDADTLTVTAVTAPAHGAAVINADGKVKYTPNANWNGTDTFTYTISDGKGGTDTATVTVTVKSVNDAPKADDSSITTDENIAVNGKVTGSDIDGDALTFVLDKAPEHGKVTLNSNGTYTYTPNVDYSGTDKFTFMSNDGKVNSAPATVTITVKKLVNPLPVTGEDTPYALYAIAALSILAGAVLLVIRHKKLN